MTVPIYSSTRSSPQTQPKLRVTSVIASHKLRTKYKNQLPVSTKGKSKQEDSRAEATGGRRD